MAKANFKETNIGKIPEEWEVRTLADVCENPEYGYTESATRKNIGPKFLRITDIQQGRVNWDDVPFCNCSDENTTKYQLKAGDILFARTGATTGKSYLIKECPKAIFASYLIRVRPKSTIISEYLFWYFNSIFYWKQIRQNIGGSTQGGVNATLLSRISVIIPPLSEQQKIALVLSTLDTSIQKTEEIIQKTQLLKKSIMNQLLIRGINHTKYKQTEIGEIPVEWNVIRVQEIAEIRSNKSTNEIEEIAVIPMELIPLEGKYADFKTLPVNQIKSSVYCEEGDILLPKITPSVENGKQGIVPPVPHGMAKATTEVYPIVCKEKILTVFLFHLLKFSKFRNVLVSRMTGSTGRQRVPKEALLDLVIPLPDHSEQQKISDIISEVDKKIEFELKRKNKLEEIKQALMNDLLTGKKRFN